MSTKVDPLNQHDLLHPHYGQADCCLCKAEGQVSELKEKVRTLKEFCEKLTKSSYPLEPEIQKLINERFWELI